MQVGEVDLVAVACDIPTKVDVFRDMNLRWCTLYLIPRRVCQQLTLCKLF